METPEWKLKYEMGNRFLRDVIYAGLHDLNIGFDSSKIAHFAPTDFLIVIDRCEAMHVKVTGIEVFTTEVKPPWKVELLEVEISPDENYEWGGGWWGSIGENPKLRSRRPLVCLSRVAAILCVWSKIRGTRTVPPRA